MPLPTDKPALRTRLKALLADISPADHAAWSAALCAHLIHSPEFEHARSILVFAPMTGAGEPDIAPLVTFALAHSKTLAVPRIDWSTRTMTPVRITSFDADLVPDLVNQRLGLRAPRPGLTQLDVAEIDLVLVPGLAFDRAGGRLGRGAGFYDRFLPTLRSGTPIVGVGFDAQILPTIPTEPHDHPLEALATESGLHRFNHTH